MVQFLCSIVQNKVVGMDAVSEVIGTIKIKNAGFTRLEANAPWGFKSLGSDCGGAKFVLVLKGSGILKVKGYETVTLSSGDVFIMLDDLQYTMSDSARSKIIDCEEVEKLRKDNLIKIGGDGSLTTFLTGNFELDAHDAKPIISALPRFLHLKLDHNRSFAFQSILNLLSIETEKAGIGSDILIARLYETLFIYSIRSYAESNLCNSTGWLKAMTDENLGEAVKAVHENLKENWTVESMAQKAAMSRTSFSNRFKQVTGQTPLEYVTGWRMHKASMLIKGSQYSLAKIAEEVGYESEAAFSRVFKKEIGKPPGEFRRENKLQL